MELISIVKRRMLLNVTLSAFYYFSDNMMSALIINEKRNKRKRLQFKNSTNDNIYLQVVYDDSKRTHEYQYISRVSYNR